MGVLLLHRAKRRRQAGGDPAGQGHQRGQAQMGRAGVHEDPGRHDAHAPHLRPLRAGGRSWQGTSNPEGEPAPAGHPAQDLRRGAHRCHHAPDRCPIPGPARAPGSHRRQPRAGATLARLEHGPGMGLHGRREPGARRAPEQGTPSGLLRGRRGVGCGLRPRQPGAARRHGPGLSDGPAAGRRDEDALGRHPGRGSGGAPEQDCPVSADPARWRGRTPDRAGAVAGPHPWP